MINVVPVQLRKVIHFDAQKNCAFVGVLLQRYKLSVRAGDDEVVVDMIFFGDIATDLLGKPVDVLIVEFLDSSALMPPEIERLVRRRYVVEVTVFLFAPASCLQCS